MPELEFNADKHEYRVDGRTVPHVTGIVNSLFPAFNAGDYYLQRGVATHYACELADQGRLDWSSVDPAIFPRVQAWQKFRRDFPAKVVGNETKLVHPTLRYAGRIDRMLEVDGELVLADLKNSVSPQVRIQLALYSLAWTANYKRKVTRAVAVELLESGEYRCLWCNGADLREAERVAVACLTVHNFREKHGLNKRKEQNV